ncbi:hypothetical protein KJ713_02945 [Patescibacteria group bacterium]|nr:hypothetical protein [Patescibacteria group bacterium]
MSWYGWVVGGGVVVVIAFLGLGGWLLIKGVFSGWGDGPSPEVMEQDENTT